MAENLEQLRRRAVGVRLKNLMDEQGVQVKELADAVGVSSGAVSQWRSGISRMSQDSIERVAAYLHTSPSYLNTGYADDGGTELFPLTALEVTLVRACRENLPTDSYSQEEKQLIDAVRECHTLAVAQLTEIVGWLSRASASDLVAALSAFKEAATIEIVLQ